MEAGTWQQLLYSAVTMLLQLVMLARDLKLIFDQTISSDFSWLCSLQTFAYLHFRNRAQESRRNLLLNWLQWGLSAAGPLNITSEELKNAALYLRLGLLPTLIRHENATFRKRFSNRRNLKTSALRFRVDGNYFENEAFRTQWRHDNDDSPGTVFLKHKSNWKDGWWLRSKIPPE